MNNCRIQLREVGGKNICTIDVLSKDKNEWFELSFIVEGEQLEEINKLLNFIKTK